MTKQLSVLAALGCAAFSCAQSNQFLDEPTNVAFRIGYVYPVDSVMRNISGSYIGVGVDIFPQGFRLLEGAETLISIDWFGKSGSGAKGNAFPILLNQRYYTTDDFASRTYYQFGLGIVLADLVNSDTALAARIGYGREFGERTFGEINFHYSDAAGGARSTALALHFGYRF